ncbi:MAG: hypothetical protein H0U12_11970 [Thermoleophilaceae bacterium]|jgi:hypothetical protein|nr:hypothetical protein [Thermoleophilaceae bacterium]
MSKTPTSVKAKKRCCKDGPRCKRCPVVLKRLAHQGLAERVGKRRYELSAQLKKKHVKRARAR